MVYVWSSFFLGTLAGLVVVAMIQAIRLRKVAPLLVAALGTVFAGLIGFFSLEIGWELIDLRLGVIFKGTRGGSALGFAWSAMFMGFAAGLVIGAAIAWLTRKEQRPFGGLFPWTIAWGALGIVVAMMLSQPGRVAGLQRSVDGLRVIVANPDAYANREMPLMVPVMTDAAFSVETVVDGLDMVTSFVFMPNGDLLLGQYDGTIMTLPKDATSVIQVAKLEGLETRGETGMLSLAVHPEYPEQPYIYAYCVPQNYDSGRLKRFKFVDGKLSDEQEIFPPLPASHFHNGGALVFGQDGMLYFSVGEADHKSAGEHYLYPGGPQDKDDRHGKIFRVTPDGQIPKDNPFAGSPVYALGTREVFRMSVDPLTGHIFFSENGETQHDEINMLVPGGNYGHPVALGLHGLLGYEEPVLDIVKTIGVTGLAIYNGDVFPEQYKYDLFFGCWNTGSMYWLPLKRDPIKRLPNGPVVEIRPKDPKQGCYLDVRQGPDGLLYYSNQSGVYRMKITEYVDPAELQRTGHVTTVDGKDMFQRYCAACHQLDGQGRPGMFPPLKGSKSLVSDPRLPAAIALFGVQSQKNAQATMPSFGAAFTDQQIAAAITYARSMWGNEGSPVNAAVVGEVRRMFTARVGQQSSEKRRALTVDEMHTLVLPSGD